MVKKRKDVTITIYKDLKMFWSEWIMFGISMLFIAGIVIQGFKFLGTVEDEALTGVVLIVFVFALLRLMSWVRFPMEFKTSDIITEFRNNKISYKY